MFNESLIPVYESDLEKVIREIELYENEEDLWKVDERIPNSGGNLALHIIGNINHYFGAVLGGTGYARERDQEFSSKNASQAEIIESLEKTIVVLKDTLNNLSDEDFEKDYPEDFGGGTQKTEEVAIYMLSHLNYHLGQINYHRRLLARNKH